jgi:hypothetical protein
MEASPHNDEKRAHPLWQGDLVAMKDTLKNPP